MKVSRVFAMLLLGLCIALTSCEKEPKSVPVTGITLDSDSLTLTEGETARLTATISPSNADNQGVIWSSSNASVASVSNGTVTAVSAGSATITAKSDDGGKTATCNVTVNSKIVAVTGVSLDKTSLELTEGEEYTLVATVLPTNASNKQISWKSNDETVATVSDGKVKAIKPGSTTITVTTSDGNKSASCSVKVNERIYHVESVSLDKTSLELTEGDEATLIATIKPDNASNKQITWKSEDETIATISDGKVKAIKPGSTIITVTTSDGNKTATCSIKVNEKIYHVESVTLDKTSLELMEGDEYTLVATVSPSNATDKSLTWTSSDNSVVAVDQNGKVSALFRGSAKISVSSHDGGNTATCTVTVKAFQPEIVDLGLSVKWASCNLGASKPEEYGDYYAWGEIETKADYETSTYKYYKSEKESDNDGFEIEYKGLTKYVSQSGASKYGFKGFYDDKTFLDPEDDVAHVKLGGKWRMPTASEIDELIENCQNDWVTYKGVNGMKFTSKKDGYTDKWIFLPAAGERRGTSLSKYVGWYRSSSLYTGNSFNAWSLVFSWNSSSKNVPNYERFYGQSVRPVCE